MLVAISAQRLLNEAGLFRAGQQMVDKDPCAPAGAGLENSQHLLEVVNAGELLDGDAFEAEVFAPDFVDQLPVMAAFDPHAARKHRRGLRLDPDRTRSGPLDSGRGLRGLGGRKNIDGLTIDPESWAERKASANIAAALEGHEHLARCFGDVDDLADEPGLHIFKEEALLGTDVFLWPEPLLPRGDPGPGKDVLAISVSWSRSSHGSRVGMKSFHA